MIKNNSLTMMGIETTLTKKKKSVIYNNNNWEIV
jgi:hypothetical protein